MAGTKQPSNKSLVIQKYLQGKSMNQIVAETRISKGKVHYLITDWKNKIAISDIDEIRDFIVLLKRQIFLLNSVRKALE